MSMPIFNANYHFRYYAEIKTEKMKKNGTNVEWFRLENLAKREGILFQFADCKVEEKTQQRYFIKSFFDGIRIA